MDRFRRTNPSASRIITSRLQARQFRIHNDMIATARASVDCHNKRAIQRRRNYKLEQMREDRNIVVDRDNKYLLKRMEEIQLTPQMDCHLQRKAAQSNYMTRLLRIQEINRENEAMLRRIMHSRSVFDSKKWVEERQEMEKRIKEMSEFDETGKAKGFVAGTGQDMALSMGAASRSLLVAGKLKRSKTAPPGQIKEEESTKQRPGQLTPSHSFDATSPKRHHRVPPLEGTTDSTGSSSNNNNSSSHSIKSSSSSSGHKKSSTARSKGRRTGGGAGAGAGATAAKGSSSSSNSSSSRQSRRSSKGRGGSGSSSTKKGRRARGPGRVEVDSSRPSTAGGAADQGPDAATLATSNPPITPIRTGSKGRVSFAAQP